MAGHSHSANIAVRKGKQDAVRAKLFSKLSRYIIIAARAGGGDPVTNLRLRYAIDKARAVSMPRENIERAIKRGTGDLDGAIMDELVYEGFGPGNTAIICDIFTDNRNRSSGEVRKIYERSGGQMGNPGCVGYMFDRKGLFLIPAAGVNEDTLMSVVLEAGAEDMSREGENFKVVTEVATFAAVQDALEKANIATDTNEIVQLPKAMIDVDLELGKRLARLIDTLTEHDDVQNVYSNVNLTPEMLASED